MLYIISQRTEENSIFKDSGFITLWTDSKYVQGILEGKFKAKENTTMSIFLVHLWTECKKTYNMEIRWVKGHSNDMGNDRADGLAQRGADFTQRLHWWKRPYTIGDWGQEVFRNRCLG